MKHRLFSILLLCTILVICSVFYILSTTYKCTEATEHYVNATSYNDQFGINEAIINQKIFDRNILKTISKLIFTKETEELKAEESEYKLESQDCELEVGDWSECDAVCNPKNISGTAVGKQTRERRIKKSPKNAGKPCDYDAYPTEKACTKTACPIDCVGEWRADNPPDIATLCNGNTSGSTQRVTSKIYYVTTQARNGGKDCPYKAGDKSQTTDTVKCNVNCQGYVSDWTACDAECTRRDTPNADGKQVRKWVQTVAKQNGGTCQYNDGDIVETRTCQKDCPVDCYGTWSDCRYPCYGDKGSSYYTIQRNAANGGNSCEAANGNRKDCDGYKCKNGFPYGSKFQIQMREPRSKFLKKVDDKDINTAYQGCIWPEGGSDDPTNGTKASAWYDCGNAKSLWNYNFSSESLMHNTKRTCLHPDNRGNTHGTKIVFWRGECDDSQWSNDQKGLLRYTYNPGTGKIKSKYGELYWKLEQPDTVSFVNDPYVVFSDEGSATSFNLINFS